MKVLILILLAVLGLAACGGSSSSHQNPDTVACLQVAAATALPDIDAANAALTKISDEPGISAVLADQIAAWGQPNPSLDDWHTLVDMCQQRGVRNDVMEGNVSPSPAPPSPGSSL